LAEAGNATEHMSDSDEELLVNVMKLIEDTIYGSVDSAHDGNIAALDQKIQDASDCNTNIDNKQSTGDLFVLKSETEDKQTELNRLYGIQEDARTVNNTKWETLASHMSMLQDPPSPYCPGLPSRTLAALNAYFERSDYKFWFDGQRAAYNTVRDEFVAASDALGGAVNDYDTQHEVRNTQYCDWKTALEAACDDFNVCFSEKSESYSHFVPEVTEWMNQRKTVKKAGDTMIHQIKFLLGEVTDQDTPEIDTTKYTIAFPELPEKTLCDLTPLNSDEWAPAVQCGGPGKGPGKP